MVFTEIIDVSDKSVIIRQWITGLIANMGFMLIGMFYAWSSPSMQYLRSPDSELYLTEDQFSWIASALYIGNILSPIPTAWLMNWIGRKMSMVLVASGTLASWIVLIFAKDFETIYISRFLGGLCVGSTFTVVPVFLSEVAEPGVRGALSTLITVMMGLGIIFQYGLGAIVPYNTLNIASAIIPLVFMASLVWVPESPYFYLMKGKDSRAEKSLTWLRCKNAAEIQEEFNSIRTAVVADVQHKGRFQDLVATAGSRKALLIVTVLAVIMRMSGISVIIGYSSSAIVPVGSLTTDELSVIMAVGHSVASLFAPFIASKVGIRHLIALSCAGCGVSQAVAAFWVYLNSNTGYDVSQSAITPFLAFMTFKMFFSIGLGCVPNMIQGVMFPSNTRGLSSGVASTLLPVVSFATIKMYFTIGEVAGIYFNYAIYSVFCFFGVYFVLHVVIETKGKSLEAIQAELAEHTAQHEAENNQMS